MIYVKPPEDDLSRVKILLEIENLKKDGIFKDAQNKKAQIELRQMKRPQIFRAKYLTTILLATVSLIVGYQNDWWKTELSLSKSSELRMGDALRTAQNELSLKRQQLNAYENIFAGLPQKEQQRMLADVNSKLIAMSQQQAKLEGLVIATTTMTTETQMLSPTTGEGFGEAQNVMGPDASMINLGHSVSVTSSSSGLVSAGDLLKLSPGRPTGNVNGASLLLTYKHIVDKNGNVIGYECVWCGKSPGHLCTGGGSQNVSHGILINGVPVSFSDSLVTGSSIFQQQ